MQTRRELMTFNARVAGMLASLSLLPPLAHAAWSSSAFDAKSMEGVMKTLGVSAPVESKAVTIRAPDVADNGALVPLGVGCNLQGTKRLLLLVEKNPTVLAAIFDLTDSVNPNVGTRVKLDQSSNVFAVAMMGDGQVLFARKQVQVILGNWSG